MFFELFFVGVLCYLIGLKLGAFFGWGSFLVISAILIIAKEIRTQHE